MKVTVDLKFKTREDPKRIHHLYFPAILATNDGNLSTKDLKLESFEILGVEVDCSSRKLKGVD